MRQPNSEPRNRLRLAVPLPVAGIYGAGKRSHALADRRQASPEAQGEASHWLREVGLEPRAHHRSGELSGGEQQRVALARALITAPSPVGGRPTGDLDGHTAEAVFTLISRLHHDHQLTSLIATHNLNKARRCHRVMRLEQGRMQELQPESLPV